MQLTDKCDKQQFIFTFGKHVLLRKPVCNPFARIYFGDWVPKILTFSPWKMPNMTKYNATQNRRIKLQCRLFFGDETNHTAFFTWVYLQSTTTFYECCKTAKLAVILLQSDVKYEAKIISRRSKGVNSFTGWTTGAAWHIMTV